MHAVFAVFMFVLLSVLLLRPGHARQSRKHRDELTFLTVVLSIIDHPEFVEDIENRAALYGATAGYGEMAFAIGARESDGMLTIGHIFAENCLFAELCVPN